MELAFYWASEKKIYSYFGISGHAVWNSTHIKCLSLEIVGIMIWFLYLSVHIQLDN